MADPRGSFRLVETRLGVTCQAAIYYLAAVLPICTAVKPLFAQSLSEAEALFNAGKYDECIAMSEKGVAEYSWYESWRHQKLDVELVLGKYVDALTTVEKGLKDFPSSIRMRFTAHKVYLQNNREDDAARMLLEIDALIQQAPWRYNNSADKITVGKYFLSRRMDARDVLEVCFDKVKTNSPTFLGTYLATGELGLAKHDYALAAEAFEQAAKLDPEDPAVHYGLARAYAPNEPELAEASLNRALALNPRHVPSLLLTADHLVDEEKYDEAKRVLARVRNVNAVHPEACAYLSVLAHLEGDSKGEQTWRNKALSSWPKNPEVDWLIGRKLSQKYRFAEGAGFQRSALAFDPDHVPAKIQLSQDLLRLGQDKEGWALASAVSDEDNYNILAYNLVTLRDTLKGFKTLEADGIVVRMGADEAEIYGRSALRLISEAKRVLCEKYDIQIEGKVAVEIYPAQKDFAIRTFGMPGGAGFLGVCFGPVITVNSPASQGESPANWQAVLWHEFCHTVTLGRTKNKMPRWLSEGISVYEEAQANPAWGQSMTPLYRQMILEGGLTPVSELSAAFLNPPSGLHLQFAYFESAMVVGYLVETHGLAALTSILDELANDVPINTALDRHAGGIDALDKEFAAYARKRAESLAPGVDWETPKLSPDADTEAIREFVEQHPTNLRGQMMLAQKYLEDKRWELAKSQLQAALALYPDNSSSDNPYRLLGRVYRELGKTEAELNVLERLAVLDASAGDVYTRLIELHRERQDWEGVAKNAERLFAVNPLIPASHRALAESAQKLGTPERAIESIRALIQMEPIDPAKMHFDLAQLLLQRGDAKDAKRHVLMALEEAPRYRDAQRLLLHVVDGTGGEDASTQAAGPTAEVTP